MTTTILNDILTYKKEWILQEKKRNPLDYLKLKIKKSKRDFYHTLFTSRSNNKTIFILECKKSSPSKKILRKKFNPIEIAQIYKNYADVISVVTDEKYFNGNFNILYQISNLVKQPILCKDFFLSEWQIYFARLHQADAILLMLSVLDNFAYQKLSKIAHTLNMGILTEISNKNELTRAISLGAQIIGINNRNLHDLSIDINRTITLSKNIPNSIVIISESGINNHSCIKQLKHYVHGFLIGTTLMSQPQLNIAVKKLILGENKICGLTQIKDAYISYKLGAIYGGLIFISSSLRCISISTAKSIISSVKNFQYVGVFRNETIYNIIKIQKILNLSIIQLHGIENQEYINILRKQLPNTCYIWKSINMKKISLPTLNLSNIHRYLLDNNGGSGKTFDWSTIKNTHIKLQNIILSGGLSIHNCAKGANIGCAGLDFNSKIEIKPGIKNHETLIKIFKILRTY